jgi:hypothetical protein
VILLTLKFINVAGSEPTANGSSASIFHFAYKTPWLRCCC